VSIALREPPDLAADAGSGIVARRAVVRWGWRLFRLCGAKTVSWGLTCNLWAR